MPTPTRRWAGSSSRSTRPSTPARSPRWPSDSQGAAHITYGYNSFYYGDLRYARKVQGAWQPLTIDHREDPGSRSSLAIDASGVAHIAYKVDYTRALAALCRAIRRRLAHPDDRPAHDRLCRRLPVAAHHRYRRTAPPTMAAITAACASSN
ncbi:MAG: hypothetical protein H6646_00330 [Anaerolineales bacterium]|nr:hypothetical protein [Anaerolineales bacterium]